MLSQFFRRLFWLIPTTMGITATLFALVSLGSQTRPLQPLFFNPSPHDVEETSAQAVASLAAGQDPQAESTLQRLGAASFPYVLPHLDALDSPGRARLSTALLPIGRRMGIAVPVGDVSEQQAFSFWARLWEQRAADFEPTMARRAVIRLARAGSDARLREVIALDTFALPTLIDTRISLPATNREAHHWLERATARITETQPCMDSSSTVDAVVTCTEIRHRWWLHNRMHYTRITGYERLTALLSATEYGTWLAQVWHYGLKPKPASQPFVVVAETLSTSARCLAGLAAAHVLGLLWALVRSRLPSAAHGALPFIVLTIPTFVAAPFVNQLVGSTIAIAVSALLAAALTPSGHNAWAISQASREIRSSAAFALGVSPFRISLFHHARQALALSLPMIAIDFPIAMSAACVAEFALTAQGAGASFLTALHQHDTTTLMSYGTALLGVQLVVQLVTNTVSSRLDIRLAPTIRR